MTVYGCSCAHMVDSCALLIVSCAYMDDSCALIRPYKDWI